ncbi:hypothetical protein ABIF65_007775 [Bradyrhizobium japonicum]|uniref:hypothetical protein n=1 Tax=Bradyrhizobium TaxID=374 RepID=UPI0012BD7F02|nr:MULTISPECIES: hypothetical protein [Bradyrhizobium]MBR1000530.1 hypothetical protein [Bradyrhizobium liaoningense]MCP1863718.1 hypothetical protein [Bradyrhizobium japonicum]MCW2327689.1 hypothetical protein [Bradyrhizobium japonicum]WLB98552.1 hypothetical protein QIH92_03305 [Bradyrhizobium japonicum USDA 123]
MVRPLFLHSDSVASSNCADVVARPASASIAVPADDWRESLMRSHSDFFPTLPGGPALPLCGPRWRDIIERCCVRIEDALSRRETFRFERIAEFQGVLRFYWGGSLSAPSEAKVRLAIDLAEARSQCVCEICGGRGRLHRHDNSFETRCSAHAYGEPVPVKPGFENMHLRQKTVVGRVRAVVCSFYDFEHDAFLDIGPSEL